MKKSQLRNIIRQSIKELKYSTDPTGEKVIRCCGGGSCDAGCKGKPCEKGQKYCPQRDYPPKEDV